MKDITQRLLSSAEWVDRNSVYHFEEDQNHNARRLSSDAAQNMLEAAETIRALRKEIEEWQDIALV